MNDTTDGTLKPTPHIVAVITGLIAGYLTTKLGVPEAYATIVATSVGTVFTTLVHFIQAKLSE